MSDLFDFLALGMSAIGIGVAAWAKRDSKRSAVAAEKSAREAEYARRIQQTAHLEQLFEAVDLFFETLKDNEGFCQLQEASKQIQKNIGYIKTKLSNDKNLCEILDKIDNHIIFVTGHGQQGKSLSQTEILESKESLELQKQFDAKKLEYLNIG